MSRNGFRRRFDVLRSVSLAGVAAEVNAERLEKRIAAGGSAKLPSDRTADAGRMRACLIALCRLMGSHRTFVVTVERLAREAEMSPGTTRRGIKDLEDGNLIAVKRRERTARRGGQGPSEYLIVWPTLVDMALSQGLQLFLNDGGLEEGEWGRRDASDPADPETSTQYSVLSNQTSLPNVLPEKTIDAQSATTRRTPVSTPAIEGCINFAAPSHSEQAPSHCGRGYARAGAIPSPILLNNPSPPGEEEKDLEGDLEKRLALYGLSVPRRALRTARDRGWSIEQLAALIAHCEAMTINSIQAFGPGLVYRHITGCLPGAPIAVQPSEPYRRAQRDRAIALQRIQDSGFRDQEKPSARELAAREANARREREYGEQLDRLGQTERDELAAAAFTGNPFLKRYYRRSCDLPTGDARRLMLLELERRAAEKLPAHAAGGTAEGGMLASGSPSREGVTQSPRTSIDHKEIH